MHRTEACRPLVSLDAEANGRRGEPASPRSVPREYAKPEGRVFKTCNISYDNVLPPGPGSDAVGPDRPLREVEDPRRTGPAHLGPRARIDEGEEVPCR